MRVRGAALFALACVATAAGCGLEKDGLAGADDASAAGDDSSRLDDASFDVSPPPGDAPGSGDAVADTFAPADSSTADAPLVDAPPLDAPADAIEAGNPCDQDGDGYKDTGNGCLGDDCCDIDPLAHPGQSQFETAPSKCGSFDYDCNGKVDAQYGLVNCQLGMFDCSGDGFTAATACGASGSFTQCVYAVLFCQQNSMTKTQGCR